MENGIIRYNPGIYGVRTNLGDQQGVIKGGKKGQKKPKINIFACCFGLCSQYSSICTNPEFF